jgi:tRNA(fMet)-specific endonuclease VapC
VKYLLDTDIFIYLIKRKPTEVLDRIASLVPGDIGISSITFAELQYGAQKSSDPARNLQKLDETLLPIEIAEFGQGASVEYGRIRVILERAGRPIGPMDMLIAAHALDLGIPLVTNNSSEFSRVPGLRIENWAERKTT